MAWYRRTSTLFGIPVAAFAITACGANSGNSDSMSVVAAQTSPATATPVTSRHNDQDITFAQGMIRHHQQAIEMAGLAEDRASSSAVKQLATSIERAQRAEIEQMTEWLRSWGASTPTSDPEQHMGEGMVSPQDIKKLAAMSGAPFDKAFLTMMINHHQGAIPMAKAEQTGGLSREAKNLAGNIADAQSAEIIKMRGLLEKM